MEQDPLLLRGQQLLDTTAAEVPDDVRVRVARVCQEVPGISAAYIARVRQTFGNDLPASEALQVGYELTVPPSSVEDARATRDVGPALLAALPPELASMGVCKLSTAAVPAWRRRGVQVFARSS
jgi:hypothetical protein